MSKQCANCGKKLGFLDQIITTTDKQTIGEECYSKVFEGGIAAQTTWEMNHTFPDFKKIYDQGDKVNLQQINQSEKEEKQNKESIINIIKEQENINTQKKQIKQNTLECPNCGSKDITFAGNKRKGFSVGKAVGGAVLTGGIGTLAGFTGKKGKKNQFICMSCGKEFTSKIKKIKTIN